MWGEIDVELFTNNQSESGKMSLAGESGGGRWSSGSGGVWRRAGRGGVMSASGMGRREEGGRQRRGVGIFFCVAVERSRGGKGRGGATGGPDREEEAA